MKASIIFPILATVAMAMAGGCAGHGHRVNFPKISGNVCRVVRPVCTVALTACQQMADQKARMDAETQPDVPAK